MSFVSIRCPNCAASETLLVGENQYQCRYCDNTFNYVDPNAPKRTVQEVQSHNCPNCGRGVTVGSSNRCTECGINDFCINCVSETPEKKLACKNCTNKSLDFCLTCGKNIIFRCGSCVKLHEKDPSHIVTRLCSEHILSIGLNNAVLNLGGRYYGWTCSDCGGVICDNCAVTVVKGGWNYQRHCKNCDNKIKRSTLIKDKDLKKQNKSFAEWFAEFSGLAKLAENNLQQNKLNP